jgi:hypothetical protein
LLPYLAQHFPAILLVGQKGEVSDLIAGKRIGIVPVAGANIKEL